MRATYADTVLRLPREPRTRAAALARRAPVAELATAVLAAASVARFGLTPKALVASVFLAVLVVLSVIDLEQHLLPNRIVLPAAAIVYVAQLAFFPEHALEWTLAALAAALILLLAHIAYPPGMGMGDVKLGLLLGAALGATVGVALVVAILTAAIAAVILLARQGRRTALPFGPFLALGAVIALFAGQPLLHAYLSTL